MLLKEYIQENKRNRKEKKKQWHFTHTVNKLQLSNHQVVM